MRGTHTPKERHTQTEKCQWTHRNSQRKTYSESHTHMETHTLRYKQTQTLRMRHIEPHERHIDRCKKKHTHWETDNHTQRERSIHWERGTHNEIETHTQRNSQTLRERHKHTERHTHTEKDTTHTHTNTQTHTQWYIQTHTVRKTHTLRDTHIALISHASKIVLKIFQARLQEYVNHELPDVQAGFRKGRGTRDQNANIRLIIKKQENSRKKKTSNSALLTVPKTLCGSQLTVENSSRWEYQTNWPASWEIYMQVSNQQVELHMEYTDSKEGKDYIKAVYCHPII